MSRVLLIRHGESTANERRVWQGHADYPLSEWGRRQAEAVAATLAGTALAAIWASPLQRAWATAEVIAAMAAAQVRADERLMEINIGAASGLTHDEVRRRFPGRDRALARGEPWAFPGQEPDSDFSSRIRAALGEMIAIDGTVVAVTHGGWIRRAAADILGFPAERAWPFAIENCSITEVVVDSGGRRVVHRLNDACHLDGLPRLSPDHHIDPAIH